MDADLALATINLDHRVCATGHAQPDHRVTLAHTVVSFSAHACGARSDLARPA